MVTYIEAWYITFKISKPVWKIWKCKINIFYILKKTNLEAEGKPHDEERTGWQRVV